MSPTSTARDRAQDFRRVAVKLAIRPRNCWASTNCWLLPGELLRAERIREAEGFRHLAPGCAKHSGTDAAQGVSRPMRASGHDRWVINKLRALASWYTKGFDNGSNLRLAINAAESLAELTDIISSFFLRPISDTRVDMVNV